MKIMFWKPPKSLINQRNSTNSLHKLFTIGLGLILFFLLIAMLIINIAKIVIRMVEFLFNLLNESILKWFFPSLASLVKWLSVRLRTKWF